MYSIDNYYIGVLNLKDDSEKILTFIENNGAIELNSSYGLNYRYSVLTVFQKTNNKYKYICLHDSKEYNNLKSSSDYCEIIMPLRDIIPKLSFHIKSNLSSKQVLNIFDLIFKNQKKIKYTNEKYNINNFYIGNLDICKSILDNNKKWKAISIPQVLLSDNNSLKKYTYYKGLEIPDKCFNFYETMFYKIGDNRFYNLDNYQTYTKDISTDKSNSFCSCLTPIKEEINKKNNITINEALKIEKKLVKKINLY